MGKIDKAIQETLIQKDMGVKIRAFRKAEKMSAVEK
jgi:hypothetical protein